MMKISLKHVLFALIICLTGQLAGCTLLLPTEVNVECCPQRWRELRSVRIGEFAIDTPTSWERNIYAGGYHGDEDVVAVTYARSPLAFPAVTVERRKTETPTLAEAARWTDAKVRAVKRGTTVELMEEWETRLDGKDAIVRDYLIESERSPVNLRKRIVSFVREDDEAALTFVTTEENFEETIPIFERMVESFETVQE